MDHALESTPERVPDRLRGPPHPEQQLTTQQPRSAVKLTHPAIDAIRKLENIKKDPLGEINSQPNHNHYSAARREAQGEVVARKADGTPFDHIADLKGARNGLENVRMALERELQNPPASITERGLEVLMKKRKETIEELDRLNGFLHSIGHR
ncbi:polymorphic toxin type 28 domain-containing protein [Streptomyces sp. NPDC001137]|uniref:polymorphic toxin type 28 domain-containing protein n=1 Tax=Streptomyces sp. NPDC001137 TaxID=3154378 RepID=UPI0033282C01